MKMPFLLISPKIVPKIQLIKKGGCFEYHAVIADKIEYRYIHRASICPVLVLSLAARIHEEGRRNLLQRMKAEGLDELTTSCGDIFMVLFAEEGQSLTAIAQKIRRTKSTTSVMADRLEKQGYIVKQVCPDDARASVICLTPKGRALKPMMMEISEKLTDDICAGLTDEEADALEKLLRKCAAGMRTAAD